MNAIADPHRAAARSLQVAAYADLIERRLAAPDGEFGAAVARRLLFKLEFSGIAKVTRCPDGSTMLIMHGVSITATGEPYALLMEWRRAAEKQGIEI